MSAVIEVRQLHKRYGDTVAVDDISFAVQEGEIFGILGPNGAGKTTTVECIEGLRNPDRGQVKVLGLDPARDRAELTQRLGVQLQDSQLPDKLRVDEALELYSDFYRNPADWRALIETLGLTRGRWRRPCRWARWPRGRWRSGWPRRGSSAGSNGERGVNSMWRTQMTTQAAPDKPPEVYNSAALAGLPYAMLAFADLLAVSLERSDPRALIADLVLSALAAAWMLWMYTLHPAWRDRPRLMAMFVTVLIVIGALLVLSDTLYGLWTFTIFIYVLRVLRWPWPLVAGAAVAVLAGTSQAYGVNKHTAVGALIYLVIVAVNIAIALALICFRRSVVAHDERRKRALDELSEANRRLEASLAENAGLQQQLLTQAREAGVLDERQRMAREIHDTLAQGLTGIITQLQAAEQAADDPEGWRRHFAAATSLARDSLSEARRSVEALRAESLETGRLSEALADAAGRWSALHGVTAQVTTTGTARPMSPEAEFALLRTAQEALANVAKHARATRVGVTLSYMEHEVALDVRDDGCGFDPARLCREAAKAAKAKTTTANGHDLVGLSVASDLRHPAARQSGGFGLVSMRQRIESLAGTLQVESEPGFGTGISACIPVAGP